MVILGSSDYGLVAIQSESFRLSRALEKPYSMMASSVVLGVAGASVYQGAFSSVPAVVGCLVTSVTRSLDSQSIGVWVPPLDGHRLLVDAQNTCLLARCRTGRSSELREVVGVEQSLQGPLPLTLAGDSQVTMDPFKSKTQHEHVCPAGPRS